MRPFGQRLECWLLHSKRRIGWGACRMKKIVAVAGFSGSGKTSACWALHNHFNASRFYAGDIVLQAIRNLGMAAGRENEILVRKRLREEHGLGALAIQGQAQLCKTLESSDLVVYDAIFSIEEYHVVCRLNSSIETLLLGIDASYEVRCERLATRLERPLDRSQVSSRDRYERDFLGTENVINSASKLVKNDEDYKTFEENVCRAVKYFLERT